MMNHAERRGFYEWDNFDELDNLEKFFVFFVPSCEKSVRGHIHQWFPLS
jgi:hypothetical protein